MEFRTTPERAAVKDRVEQALSLDRNGKMRLVLDALCVLSNLRESGRKISDRSIQRVASRFRNPSDSDVARTVEAVNRLGR